jgi:hypothetical protein
VIEGTSRAYAFRDGRYVDAYMMARLYPDGALDIEGMNERSGEQ